MIISADSFLYTSVFKYIWKKFLMKRILPFIVLSFFLFSCQTRVVSLQKPIQANSLELYQKYTIITNTPAEFKVQVLKQDAEKIYAKDKKGQEVIINKNEIREVKKLDLFASIAIGVAALAAVIFVPI